MRRLAKAASLLALCLWSNGVAPASAQTITVSHAFSGGNRGWYASTSGINHDPDSPNYFTGTGAPVKARSYFVFDLSTLDLTGKVLSGARIKLRRFDQTGAQTVTFWDVSTPMVSLKNDTSNLATFEDLGTGVNYGSTPVPTGSNSDIITFALNGAAMASLSAAAGGEWATGASTSGEGSDANSNIFEGSNDPGTHHTLELDLLDASAVPEPGALAMFLPALALFGVLKQRRASCQPEGRDPFHVVTPE